MRHFCRGLLNFQLPTGNTSFIKKKKNLNFLLHQRWQTWQHCYVTPRSNGPWRDSTQLDSDICKYVKSLFWMRNDRTKKKNYTSSNNMNHISKMYQVSLSIITQHAECRVELKSRQKQQSYVKCTNKRDLSLKRRQSQPHQLHHSWYFKRSFVWFPTW